MGKDGLNKYLSKLSVVVLSFNKKLSLKATLNYWSNYPVELIILDGSYKKTNLIIKNEHNPNFKLRYYHEPISYFDRIIKATYLILLVENIVCYLLMTRFTLQEVLKDQ